MLRLFIVLSTLFLFACNQETTIGTDLINDQIIDVQVIDTLDIRASTIEGEPLIVFVNSTTNTTTSTNLGLMPIGQTQDDVFGSFQSTAFFNIILNPAISLEEDIANVDSVILTLPLDTLGAFGTPNVFHDYELFELTETMTSQDTFRTNDFFDFDPMPIGTMNGIPRTQDSLLVFEPSVDSMVLIRPHLRIPINENYWSRLISKTNSANGNNEEFVSDLFGFAFRSNTNVSSIVSINMSNSLAAFTEVNVYYKNSGGEEQIYSYPIGILRTLSYEHDLTGSATQEAIDDQSISDSLLYLQGFQGPDIEVDLSPIRNIDMGRVNLAQLEFSVAIENGVSLDEFPVFGGIGAFFVDELGVNTQIEDLVDTRVFFGGELEEIASDTLRYTMNITNHVQNIINGEVQTDRMILVPFNKQSLGNRVVIFGTENSTSPMRLRIVQTNP